MLLASFIWGTAFVAQTISIGTVGALTYTGLRFLLGACVVLVVIAVLGRRGRPVQPHAGRGVLLRDGTLLGAVVAISIALQQIGLESTTVANAGFISALYVILVPIMAMVMGSTRTGPGIWIGATLALVGMYFLSVHGDFTVRHGDWLELIGALFISLQMVLLGRFAPRHDSLQLAAVQFLACAVLCLGTGLAVEPISLDGLRAGAWTIIYGGALSVGVAYTLQVVAQRDAIPAHAAVIFSMEGVFAALAAWVVLGQSLDARAMLGCALVFSGLIASQLPRRGLASAAAVVQGWLRGRGAASGPT